MCIAGTQNGPATSGVSKHSLTFGSWNLNGIYDRDKNSKLEDPWVNAQLSKCDIFAVVETHLESNTVSFDRYLNFSINREKSRNNRHYGGISVFIHENIHHHVSNYKVNGSDYIWLKIDHSISESEQDIYLCFCYIPPENSSIHSSRQTDVIQELQSDIMDLSQKGQIIIAGDLNARTATISDFIIRDDDKYIPMFDEYPIDDNTITRNSQDVTIDERGKQLVDICTSAQLRILNGRKLGDSIGHFTCHKWNGSSVVDYIIVSREILPCISKFQVGEYNNLISDHCLVLATIRLPSIQMCQATPTMQNFKPAPKKITFNQITTERYTAILKSECYSKKINSIEKRFNTIPDINTNVGDLNNILLDAVQAAGISSLQRKANHKGKRKSPGWYDSQLRDLRKVVLKLGNRVASFPFDKSIRNSYFLFLKKYRKATKHAKRKHLQSIVDKINALKHNDPKTFWGMLNNIAEINGSQRTQQENISADTWVNHYKTLNTSQVPATVEAKFKLMIEDNTFQSTFNSLDFRITEAEVIKAASSLKNNKSLGTDYIASEMIKLALPSISLYLAKLFNKILSTSIYPEIWTESYICNIFKSGNKNDPSNYRGIAISSILGKTFNSLLNSRLYSYLVENNLIDISQIGFMKGSSTSDHILTLRTIIEKYKSSKKKTFYLCFINFRKAFDTVWHSGLIYKLQKIGINGNLLRTIQNMYAKSSIRINKQTGV
jgi:hypothetical protein